MLKFIDAFYMGVLGVTDYWMRFEWRHRGSPHVHGLAWVPNAPDVEQLLSPPEISVEVKEEVIRNADCIVSTCNPAVFHDEVMLVMHRQIHMCTYVKHSRL